MSLLNFLFPALTILKLFIDTFFWGDAFTQMNKGGYNDYTIWAVLV